MLLGTNQHTCPSYEVAAHALAYYSSAQGWIDASKMLSRKTKSLAQGHHILERWSLSMFRTSRGRHPAEHKVRSRSGSSPQVGQATIGDVESCIECCTDTAISFVDIPGPGSRVWAMTCWKDLGSDEPSGANSIYKHYRCDGTYGPSPEPRAPERRIGSIYEAFEREAGNHRDGSNGWQAVPSNSALVELLWQRSQHSFSRPPLPSLDYLANTYLRRI